MISIEQDLADSAALNNVAKQAGVSAADAKRMAAALAALDPVQLVRICTTAQTNQARQRARQQRKTR